MYRQIVGIPMGTNCAPLAADLFLFCYERDFMLSLSDNRADVVEAFNSATRYLDVLLNIDNPYFEQNGKKDISHWTWRIPLTLKPLFWTWIVYNEWLSFIYYKRDDFNFE